MDTIHCFLQRLGNENLVLPCKVVILKKSKGNEIFLKVWKSWMQRLLQSAKPIKFWKQTEMKTVVIFQDKFVRQIMVWTFWGGGNNMWLSSIIVWEELLLVGLTDNRWLSTLGYSWCFQTTVILLQTSPLILTDFIDFKYIMVIFPHFSVVKAKRFCTILFSWPTSVFWILFMVMSWGKGEKSYFYLHTDFMSSWIMLQCFFSI